jgi:hypothetical protein
MDSVTQADLRLDDAMDPLSDFAIDYPGLLGKAGPDDLDALIEHLTATLPDLWIDEYYNMVQHQPYILEVPDRGFNFLFDLTLENHDRNDSARPDDRVVAAYGLSKPSEGKRDASRIRGFGIIGGLSRGRMDKGHLMAHSMGGSLDINIFPQRPDVNRGRSASGKVYRRMERYAAKHPGTFVFSRPIYLDSTWVPHALEYGLLLSEPRFWIERFPN